MKKSIYFYFMLLLYTFQAQAVESGSVVTRTKVKELLVTDGGSLVYPFLPLPVGPPCRKFHDRFVIAFEPTPIKGEVEGPNTWISGSIQGSESYGNISGSFSGAGSAREDMQVNLLAETSTAQLQQTKIAVISMAMVGNKPVTMVGTGTCTSNGFEILKSIRVFYQ